MQKQHHQQTHALPIGRSTKIW